MTTRRRSHRRNSLTIFMSITFAVLAIVAMLGGYFLLPKTNTAKADGTAIQTINASAWGGNKSLMKQVADKLGLVYSATYTIQDYEKLLERVTSEDLDIITELVLVNQQLTRIPEVLRYFKNLTRIDLSGNQLLDIPEFLRGKNIDIGYYNNIFSPEYEIDHQFSLFVVDVMEQSFNNIIMDKTYDEEALKKISKDALWLKASTEKNGEMRTPLSQEHSFVISYDVDVDGKGNTIDNYIDKETGTILKEGKVQGEIVIKGADLKNKNARHSFEMNLVNGDIKLVPVDVWENNDGIIESIKKQYNLSDISEFNYVQLGNMKELYLTEKIHSFPKIFTELGTLNIINLSKFTEEFTPDLSSLANVSTVNLSGIENPKLINTVNLSNNIHTINISGNKLLEIPQNIKDNENLSIIDISDNYISAINDEQTNRYITDGNLLGENFPNQKSLKFNFKKENLLEILSIEELNEYINNNTELVGVGKIIETPLEVVALAASGDEITNINSEIAYIGIKGINIENENLVYSVDSLDRVGSTIEGVTKINLSGKNSLSGNTSESVDGNKSSLYAVVEVSDIKEAVEEKDTDTIQINSHINTIIKKEAIDSIVEKEKNLTFNHIINDESSYKWRIDSENLNRITEDINLTIDFINETQIEKEIKNNDMVLAFRYNGASLPESANLTISRKNQFAPDETYYLYKYNNDLSNFEYAGAVFNETDDIIMSVNMSDEYFVVKNIIEDAAGNPGAKSSPELNALNITLLALSVITMAVFIVGSRQVFVKKSFVTKMPVNKTYRKEYENLNPANNAISNIVQQGILNSTAEFNSITVDMLPNEIDLENNINLPNMQSEFPLYDDSIPLDEAYLSNNYGENYMESLSLVDEIFDFKENQNHNVFFNENTTKFSDISIHFGENAYFKGAIEKNPAEFKNKENNIDINIT